MDFMLNHPRILAVICLLAMWFMARLGTWIRVFFKVPEHEDKDNLAIVVSATLTLLALIIGFTFSMATTRYDQRRLYEEQEPNAIGTEYVRADLFPLAEATAVKQGLAAYLHQRIIFYQADYGNQLDQANVKTSALQAQLWNSIEHQASTQPNPVTALVVSGMNDVLNSQGYTQSAWWNRIPVSAWELMIVIAIFANGLIGYAAQRSKYRNTLLLVLPLIVSISFFLIADIDSPRGGTIRIPPKDLLSLEESLKPIQR
jgi:hypothetical protein